MIFLNVPFEPRACLSHYGFVFLSHSETFRWHWSLWMNDGSIDPLFFSTDSRVYSVLLVTETQPQIQAPPTDRQKCQSCEPCSVLTSSFMSLLISLSQDSRSHNKWCVTCSLTAGRIPETLRLTDHNIRQTSHSQPGMLCVCVCVYCGHMKLRLLCEDV